MAFHHYVPAHVISRFLPDNPEHLELPENATRAERRRQSNGEKRRRLVLTWERASGKIVPRAVRKVLGRNGLYNIPYSSDPIQKGRVAYTFRVMRGESPGCPSSLPTSDFLLQMGKEAPDSNFIEDNYTQSMDSRFAGMVPKLLRREEIESEESIIFLIRYLLFTRTRTPAWMKSQWPKILKDNESRLRNRLQFNVSQIQKQGGKIPKDWDLEASVRSFAELIYPAHVMFHFPETNADIGSHPLGLAVLHTTKDVPFVLPDNPMRPVNLTHRNQLQTSYLPGFCSEETIGIFPFDPRACLLMSSKLPELKIQHTDTSGSVVRKLNTTSCRLAMDTVVLPARQEGLEGLFEGRFRLRSRNMISRP